MPQQGTERSGKVYLVGAGPGDPGLITLRGVRCLERADAVLYDYLANARLLKHTRPGAELICLGRHGHTRIWSQEEINQKLVELAQQGQQVVRLKAGDPAIFARAAEELHVLEKAGIPCEIVPGITAALAAGSHAGIPLTHRDAASAVALVTGQESPDKTEEQLDYAALARFPGTLVFYMGVTTARHWSHALIEHGKPPETPVGAIRRCSWPDQRSVRSTLRQLAEGDLPNLRPPVIFIVGEVVHRKSLSWFESRPLFGTSVLITRPLDQADTLAEQLDELGAETLIQPAIEIREPADWRPVDAALDRLDQFDWLVFSSANGVDYWFGRLLERGRDLRALRNLKLAAIGPATAERLEHYHLRADLQPDEYRAEALADQLLSDAGPARFLLLRASRGREVLSERLLAAGATVEQVVVYSSTDVTAADPEIQQRLAAGSIGWITVTSSAIARSLVTLFGQQLRHSRLVSISPITSQTLRDLGYEVAAEAREYTMRGVVEALAEAAREQIGDENEGIRR